jgi:hypothetical protein
MGRLVAYTHLQYTMCKGQSGFKETMRKFDHHVPLDVSCKVISHGPPEAEGADEGGEPSAETVQAPPNSPADRASSSRDVPSKKAPPKTKPSPRPKTKKSTLSTEAEPSPEDSEEEIEETTPASVKRALDKRDSATKKARLGGITAFRRIIEGK